MVEPAVAVVPRDVLDLEGVVGGGAEIHARVLVVVATVAAEETAGGGVHIDAVGDAHGGIGVAEALVVLDGGARCAAHEADGVELVVGDRVLLDQVERPARDVNAVLAREGDAAVAHGAVGGARQIDRLVLAAGDSEAVHLNPGEAGEPEAVEPPADQRLPGAGIRSAQVHVEAGARDVLEAVGGKRSGPGGGRREAGAVHEHLERAPGHGGGEVDGARSERPLRSSREVVCAVDDDAGTRGKEHEGKSGVA